MKTIPFVKMSGSGNDFIVIDNRESIVDEPTLKVFIKNVCRRKLSAGADGMILIEPSSTVDFKWRFFNSDASRAEMCGNGARCAARFAFINGIAGKSLSFETDAGIISAEILAERVKIKMTDPGDLQPHVTVALDDKPVRLSTINTGVPHAVLEEPDLETADIVPIGRALRSHPAFAPAGTNVNFITPRNEGIAVRTYERGVEDETLACGTGAVASALVSAELYDLPSPIRVSTRSGSVLTVHFTRKVKRFRDVFLEGDARIIYRGDLWQEAWEE